MRYMSEREQREIFDRWLESHKGLLFKVVRAYARDDDDRNDLFQEISLQMYRSIPRFRGDAAVSTWLYRIALNTAIRWSTQNKKRTAGQHSLDDMGHLLEVQKDQPDDRITWLYEQIKELSEIDRSLTLLLLDGYSYKEMSELLGISESNIGVKIHRIKKQLVNNSKEYAYGL